MKTFFKNSFILLFLLIQSTLIAQQNKINDYTTIRYDHILHGGLLLHTNGIGLDLQYMINRKVNRNLVFNLDITSLKHPKETRVINPNYEDVKSYFYGRMNSIIPVRLGIGNQFIIADKEIYNGIRLTFNYALGASLTLLKPEYLNFIYREPLTNKGYLKVEIFDPTNEWHTNQGNIYGGTSFFKGFESLKARPGGFVKLNLGFEWGDYEEHFRMLETGVLIDAYPEALPIYAFIENKYVYLNFFVNLNIGRRW